MAEFTSYEIVLEDNNPPSTMPEIIESLHGWVEVMRTPIGKDADAQEIEEFMQTAADELENLAEQLQSLTCDQPHDQSSS